MMKKLPLWSWIAWFLIGGLFHACTPSASSTEAEPTAPPSFTDPDFFDGQHQAQAMVLGVFHFHNPGLDDYKPQFPFDIMEEKRQRELDTLLALVARYRPTKILLEVNRIQRDSVFNVAYQAYLRDSFDLSLPRRSNEVFQIGFQLAKQLGHDRIYCSDARADWFGVELDWDNFDEDAYLRSLGQYDKTYRYDFEKIYRRADSLKTVQPLVEHLRMLNDPRDRLKDHQAYLTGMLLSGAGDNYLGADSVARWYRRNFRIFANAYYLTNFDQPERLLLLYGAGHVWQLRQLFLDSPDYEYVEVNEYLSQ
ncbi:MAG: DUF5694 domain-containing protein [Bacteroidota bacterium]